MGSLEFLERVQPELRRWSPEAGSCLRQEGRQQGQLLHGRTARRQAVQTAGGVVQSIALSE